jgi:hypothetical protein
MTLIQRYSRIGSIHVVIFLFAVLLLGCSPQSKPSSDIGQDSSRDQVLALLGEPDETQDFILPDHPFFGPQEGLANLVAPGTVIEEWVYEIGDEVLYIWFTGELDEPRDNWLVLATARYPQDAIF